MPKHWLGLALSTLCLAAVVAQAAPATRQAAIQNVLRSGSTPVKDASPRQLELSKFLVEPGDIGETYRVQWSPGEKGLAAGVVLRFTYRQADVSEPLALEIQYPFAVRNSRVATFEIAPKAIRRGGEVVAWRVELLQHGKQLAEKSSGFRK